jgi:hypothetical protein
MAWDSSRKVPWKRLGMYLAIYALAMAGFTAVTNGNVRSLIGGLAFGVPIAGLSVVVLAKFGYMLPILKSRDELAAERAARIAQRRAARGDTTAAVEDVEGPRARPAPTRRTTTGPSQRPNRNARKR